MGHLAVVVQNVINRSMTKPGSWSSVILLLALWLMAAVSCSQKSDIDAEKEPMESTSAIIAPIPSTTPTQPNTVTADFTTAASPNRAKATGTGSSVQTEIALSAAAASPSELSPTTTPLPPTATPDDPPAAHFNVGLPDRMASDCSPDYPCNDDIDGWESRMRVPPGFEAAYFTRVEGKPTTMTVGPEGNLFVAVITGTIYTVNSDGQVGEYYQGLKTPTGLAFQPGTDRLYFSSRLIDDNVAGEGQVGYIEDEQLTQVLDGLPCCYSGMHGPNGIAFGPDGFGYIGIGGRADHGEILIPPNEGRQDELHPWEASIMRFSPDGEEVEVYARGFRNPYDLAWDVEGRLYATDNGRDESPGEESVPPDELHEVIPGAEHGYPYYACPGCFGIPEGIEVIAPLQELVPHGAVTGISAYIHDAFPGYYNDLFLVLWSAFPGAQKVQRVGQDRTEISDFATGFAAPIDIVVGQDGSLYVADFATGIIFRITYVGDPDENSN